MPTQIGAMLFPLGKLLATPGALAHLDQHGVFLLHPVLRHVNGDWGDLGAEDGAANHRAVVDGSRILSAYVIGDAKVYVITESDRSSTTVLLASEY
jgi:hypothetical protein